MSFFLDSEHLFVEFGSEDIETLPNGVALISSVSIHYAYKVRCVQHGSSNAGRASHVNNRHSTITDDLFLKAKSICHLSFKENEFLIK